MSRLTDLGIVCALGTDCAEVLDACLAPRQPILTERKDLIPGKTVRVGQVRAELPDMAQFKGHFRSRNNQLALLAYGQIEQQVKALPYAAKRVGVILGTSTSGIAQGEEALASRSQGRLPADYHYATQEMYAPAEFIAHLCQARGPVYVISTACSSSAKAMISAAQMIEAGLVDAVITGGVDSLCGLTPNGFAALESVSASICRPFCAQRDGINIGEAAALFVMQRTGRGVRLAGYGESSDAYHISAPHPQGLGAIRAMEKALQRAGIQGSQLDYLNLHGTGTIKNDEMEAAAVLQLAEQVPCSSTKALTGHTLGAAGALEAALCWLLMSEHNVDNRLPANISEGQRDPALARMNLLEAGYRHGKPIDYCLSNSFAFGGSNAALLLARN